MFFFSLTHSLSLVGNSFSMRHVHDDEDRNEATAFEVKCRDTSSQVNSLQREGLISYKRA